MWSSASSFNFQYPIVSLRSSSSCLCLISHLHITSILLSIFPSVSYFRKQFLRKMWPIQLVFLPFIVCRIFLSSLTVCNTLFLTWSAKLIFSILLQHHISKLSWYFWSSIRSVQVSAPYKAVLQMKHFNSIFLNLIIFLVDCFFYHGPPGLKSPCTSCIIYCHATRIRGAFKV
jgi:hypothetical protein